MPGSGGCSVSISFFPAAIEREWSKCLGGSLDDRLAADYDFEISFSFDEAQRECRRAREFIERIRRYLIENGLTDDDLGKETEMAEAVISYDKDLPEIPGRRPSKLLLTPKIRAAVDAWRAGGYEGASDVTRRLFEYWFEEDHEVPGFDAPLRYYFCQREAIETLVWLVEIAGRRDTQALIRAYATIFKKDLFTKNITFQTRMDGRRQLRRYVPELNSEGVQDLPPQDLRRFAFKMATGSGKTWVMAMAVVWARFHKQRVPGSELSTNFLIVAPNVIVYQRLEKDFANNRIFHELPLIPPEWKGTFSQKVILRGEAAEPDPSGNLFLTNIHQLYESRDQEWTPGNPSRPCWARSRRRTSPPPGQRSMLERVKSLRDLVVLNDEAHHVHDENLKWSQSLLAVHRALPRGLGAWLDFSATPKDQNGMYFPWTVCDYPLAQAVEDRIVKAPIIVTKEDDPQRPTGDPGHVTKRNVVEKYGYWLGAAVQRWKEHRKVYQRLDTKSVLFIMAEKNVYADKLGEYLWKTKEFGFKKTEVLVIHIDNTGEVRSGDLEKARQAARDIDKAESKVKAIVSVMMLREGWDVRNVTVVLGLRPFTARAEILPEQVIGRGSPAHDTGKPRPDANTGGTRHTEPARRAANPTGSGRRRRGQYQERPATTGHHCSGKGTTGIRHRDSDHQAKPETRHP